MEVCSLPPYVIPRQALGKAYSYEYDDAGNISKITNPNEWEKEFLKAMGLQ